METITRISRQFVAWATALQSKYRDNFYFRTILYVVALQTGLVVITIVAFGVVLYYTDERIVMAVTHQLLVSSRNPSAALSPALPQAIDIIQSQGVTEIFVGIVVVAVLFGILLAYATLRPARKSLEYQKLFISNIAHELRTPLSIMRTNSEVALLNSSMPRDTRNIFTEILEETERASGVINNLISLNRFLQPEHMEMKSVDLGSIVDVVVERRQKFAQEHAIEVMVRKSSFTSVWGNAAALEQVVANLVNNALHYTPHRQNGRISITIGPNYSGSVVLSIADTGIGIAQKDLYHILEPFYRADLSRTRRVSHHGSGLGLTIVSEIVRAHRGKLTIESALGKGTTVTVLLPAYGTPASDTAHRADAPVADMSQVSADFSNGA
jgi:signal transduction histidine kinase